MWRPWVKLSPSKPDKFESSSSVFRCSSFKDICLDPDFLLSPPPELRQQHSLHRPVFHRVLLRNSTLKPRPEPDSQIVVYYTSLRVVRTTFEACRSVLSILRGLRVKIDERDVAMDSSLMSELRELLGSRMTSLPRVFIGGRYIGGADEVFRLNEIGELKKMVEGMPPVKPGTCGTCGGYRFILCDECSGSHKIFSQKMGVLRSCTTCNENGLIKCPTCFCPSLNRPISPHRRGC